MRRHPYMSPCPMSECYSNLQASFFCRNCALASIRYLYIMEKTLTEVVTNAMSFIMVGSTETFSFKSCTHLIPVVQAVGQLSASNGPSNPPNTFGRASSLVGGLAKRTADKVVLLFRQRSGTRDFGAQASRDATRSPSTMSSLIHTVPI